MEGSNVKSNNDLKIKKYQVTCKSQLDGIKKSFYKSKASNATKATTEKVFKVSPF